MGLNEVMKEQSEQALLKQKKDTRTFIVRTIPMALWTAATVFVGACSFNSGNAFYIVCGMLAIIGSIIFLVKELKRK